MKHARIIIALLVLLGAASLAEAQVVVSQTTASTTKVYEKSGREKGLVVRPELGLTYIEYNPEGVFLNAHAIIAYQFNPYFAIGAGTGVDNTFCGSQHYENPVYTGIPVYANARVYFLDRKFSPYFDLKIGYHFSINECSQRRPEAYGIYSFSYQMKGLLASGTIGVQYRCFDLGFTVSYFESYTTYYISDAFDSNSWYPTDFRPNQPNLAFMVSLAYNLQFQKKQ